MTTLDDLCAPWAPGEAPDLDDLALPRSADPLRAQWQRDGLVILPGLVTDALIDAYADAWLADNAERPGGWPYDVPYMHVPAVADLACDGDLADMLEHLIGEPMGVHLNLTGWRSTTRNWHQDGYLNPDTTADWYAAVWVALDDIHPDAGPFEYVPGSHREFGVIRQDRMLAALDPTEHGPDWPRHSERILTPLFEEAIAERDLPVRQFLAKKGDVLIWHARLLHRGSPPRDTALERRGAIFHYSGIHHRPDMPAAPVQHPRGGWYFPIDQGGHR